MDEAKRFEPIEATAKYFNLSPYFIRQGVKKGWIPHIKCGSKVMINIPKLTAILDSESENHNPTELM